MYSPSIDANANGDVVIGYSRSGSSLTDGRISSYASIGTTSGGVTSFGSPTLLLAGTGTTTSGNVRLGDYSETTRDPTDPQIFWTIQQVVTSTGTWATNATEIIVPANADERRWKLKNSGSFGDSANWNDGTIAGSQHHAIFSRATAGTNGFVVDMPASTTTTLDRLSVRQGTVSLALNGGVLDLTNTGSLATSLTIAEFGGTPSVLFSGGTLLTRSTSLAAGSLNTAATSTATLAFSNATWTSSGSVYVGGSATAAGGHVIIALSSSARATIGGNLKVYSNGTVNYDFGATSTDHLGLTVTGSLDLSSGGRLLQTTNGSRLLKVGNVVTANTGTLDLNDNDLIVTNAGSGTTGYLSITSQIEHARFGGSWTEPGITSHAAAFAFPLITTLGCLKGDEYKSVFGGTATFGGSGVADGDVLVKYT